MSTRNPYWLQVGKHPPHYFLYISSSIFSSLKTQIRPLPPSTLQLSKGLIPLTGECWQCTETARSPVCAVPPGFSPAVNQRINSVSASALHPPWKHPTFFNEIFCRSQRIQARQHSLAQEPASSTWPLLCQQWLEGKSCPPALGDTQSLQS